MIQYFFKNAPKLAYGWVFGALLFVLTCFTAPVESTYILRYSTVAQNGAIVFGGNTLGLSKQVNQNQPGTSDAIGAFITTDTTQKVGNYPAGTTLDWTQNSSAAVIDIPDTATVLYAELIWGGSNGYFNEGANQGEDPNIILYPATVDPVKFTTPDNVVHDVYPDQATMQNVQNPAVSYPAGNYTRSANVTSLVQSGGGGTYICGGVPATISALDNTHNAAGWTLAVVYQDPTQRTNNMSIFVGCEQASYTTNNPAFVTGFCTPPSDIALAGRLYVSAIEGDPNKTGDHMDFGPTPTTMVQLSGPNNDVNDFFAAQINNSAGILDTRGTFGNLNSVPPNVGNPARQGYDITSVDVTSALTSNQTSAYALGTTVSDDYTINALGIQIAVDAPIMQAVKTVNGQNSILANVGDTVTFAVTLQNTGFSDATDVVFKDPLETGLTLVPNTFTINGTSVSNPDLVGGVPLANFVGQSAVTTVQFQALINAYPAVGNIYYNASEADYDFVPCQQSTPISLVAQSNQVSIILPAPPPLILAVETVNGQDAIQANVGDTVTFAVTLQNVGYGPATNIAFINLLDTGLTFLPNTFTINGNSVSNPDLVNGVPLPDFDFEEHSGVSTVQFQAVINSYPITGNIYYNSSLVNYDFIYSELNTSTNQVSIALPETPPVMQIVKTVNGGSSTSASVGDTVTFNVAVQNIGYDPASNVLFIDPLQPGLTLVPGTFTINSVPFANPDLVNGVPLGYFGEHSAVTTVQFQALVNTYPAAGNIYYNSSSVDYDFNYTEQSATSNTVSVVLPESPPVLQVVKTVNGQNSIHANVGDTVTFAVTIQNVGYDPATNVMFIDPFLPSLSLVPDTFTINGVPYANPDLLLGVPLGFFGEHSAVTTVQFQAVVNSYPAASNIYHNSAIIDYDFDYTQQSVISNTVSIILPDSPPVMQLVKTVNGENSIQANVGDTVTFAVAIQNVGYDPATNVLFIDPLQTGLTLVPNTFTINGTPVSNPDLVNGVPLGYFGEHSAITTVQFQAVINSYPTNGNILFNSSSVDYDFNYTEESATSNTVSIILPVIPPIDPVPPTDFVGSVASCKFLNKTDSYLRATWDPVTATGLISYHIYLKGVLVAEIPAGGSTTYKTKLSSRKSAKDYTLTAVYTGNIESTPVNIRITNE